MTLVAGRTLAVFTLLPALLNECNDTILATAEPNSAVISNIATRNGAPLVHTVG